MMIRSLMLYYKNVYIMVWKKNKTFLCLLVSLWIWFFGAAAAVVVVVFIKWRRHGTWHRNWQIIMSFWAWLLDLLMHGQWLSKKHSHRIKFLFSFKMKMKRQIYCQMTTHINHKQHSKIKISKEKKTYNALSKKKKRRRSM